MIDLVVAPIVEGDGEVAALPILLRRIATDCCDECSIDVLQPVRKPASSLLKIDSPVLAMAVSLAAGKLKQHPNSKARKLILMLIDADGKCAAKLGPELKSRAEAVASHMNIATVLAVDEYETWFVAAAVSLSKYINVSANEIPMQPEAAGAKKKWIDDRIRAVKYSETVDQPKFSAMMDLKACRLGSPSFDKLCREIERMAKPDDEAAAS